MAGMFGRSLGNGWRMPPPYSEIEDQQAAAMGGGYSTPGIGDGLPGARPIGGMFGGPLQHGVGKISPDMPKPKFFAKDGGWRGVLGALGDGLAAAGGGQGVYAPMMLQKRKDEREDQRFSLLQQREERMANKPQFMERNDGSIVAINPMDRTVQQIGDPVAAPAKPTDLQQKLEYWASLPDGPQKDIARAAIVGATNDPNFYRQKQAAEFEYDQRLRQTPTYADLHPAPKPKKVKTTKVINGQAYYNIDGRWYDNPEGE